jgi:DNA-binding response OmpR family regulator
MITGHHDCIGCPHATADERIQEIVAYDGYLRVQRAFNRVIVGGKQHKLPGGMVRVLAALARTPGQTVTYEQLLLALESDAAPKHNRIIVQVRTQSLKNFLLRAAPDLKILTVEKVGYYLTREPRKPAKPH